MFLGEVEAIVEIRIVDKCLLQETFFKFYTNTHETVLLLFYLLFITVSNYRVCIETLRKPQFKPIKRAFISVILYKTKYAVALITYSMNLTHSCRS